MERRSGSSTEALGLREAGGVMSCHICGTWLHTTRYRIGDRQYVCLDCELAKGGWEDTRLDEYGRIR